MSFLLSYVRSWYGPKIFNLNKPNAFSDLISDFENGEVDYAKSRMQKLLDSGQHPSKIRTSEDPIRGTLSYELCSAAIKSRSIELLDYLLTIDRSPANDLSFLIEPIFMRDVPLLRWFLEHHLLRNGVSLKDDSEVLSWTIANVGWVEGLDLLHNELKLPFSPRTYVIPYSGETLEWFKRVPVDKCLSFRTLCFPRQPTGASE